MNDEIQFYVSLELIKSFLVDKLVSAVQIKVYTKYIHNTYTYIYIYIISKEKHKGTKITSNLKDKLAKH